MDEMDRLTELGTALYPEAGPRPELRARALTPAPPAGPPPRRRLRPALAVAGVAVLATGAVALAGALNAGPDAQQDTGSGLGTVAVRPVGYTITVNLDGSVTFTANDLVDAAAATQALNAAGISGRVINASKPGTCTSGPNHDGSVDPDQLAGHAKGPLLMPEDSTTIRSSDYPPGGGVLIVVHAVHKQQSEIAFLIRLAYNDADDIPSCVDLSR